MKKVGNIIIDLKNIDSISTNGNGVLILFKSKNSKTYNEQELGLSVRKFIEEVEELVDKGSDLKELMFFSLLNGLNNNK